MFKKTSPNPISTVEFIKSTKSTAQNRPPSCTTSTFSQGITKWISMPEIFSSSAATSLHIQRGFRSQKLRIPSDTPYEMVAVTAQTSLSTFVRPCTSRTRFLTGSSGKLNREIAVKPASVSSIGSFKVEAKKGEWLPGLASPSYLNGSLAGDNGFDPLGLAEDPENLKWFVQAELVNGRWAMLGVAGMLLPEVLTSIGIINVPKWYDAGKAQYFASSSTLFVIEFILFHYVEIRRWQDIKNPGSVNQDPIFKQYSLPPNEVGYPGGIFNPLNFAPSIEAKEKEIANGRLAMLAFLGFIVQHNVTGKGPFENLQQHLSDPWHNTIVQTLSGN